MEDFSTLGPEGQSLILVLRVWKLCQGAFFFSCLPAAGRHEIRGRILNHVVPLARGGSNSYCNLVFCCVAHAAGVWGYDCDGKRSLGCLAAVATLATLSISSF